MRAALKDSLFPFVLSRGFVLDHSSQPRFTVFRRHAGPRVHVFEVQWDKSGKPRFVINFGSADSGSVKRRGTSVPDSHVEVFDCTPMMRLQRKPGASMACWFQLRRPILQQIAALSREYTPAEVALSVLSLFPQVETWLEHGELGPNVHVIGGSR